MSMQRGAKSIEELINEIRRLAKDMQESSDCINGTQEITITLDDDDNSFTITCD